MYLSQGTELHSRYVIQSLLGHGGFGITYAAHDQVLNVRVAVKEYLPRQLATRGEGQTKVSIFTGEARQQYDYGLRKFLEEAQSVARFAHHPNVVSARDYFEANGTAYMVMEYVEGVTLKEYLEKKGGRISFEEAKGIMMPVMDALREVHQAGMLHRDISPDNIYITTAAQVKILDFGAARYFAGEQSKSLSVILKPGYAPEEQYRSSGKQGSWTDVYGVGATIYKALTGRTPPDALDRKEEDTLEPPSRLGVMIPVAAEQALLQALAVRAEQRFQTMAEFQQALLGDAPMTMGFQTASFSFPPTPEASYIPPAEPSFEPSFTPAPVSAAPSPTSGRQPSHYPQLPQRGANPAAIAAGIGAGVVGLALVVLLIWYIGGRVLTEKSHAIAPEVTPEVKAKVYSDEGVKQYQKGNFKDALKVFEKARDLNPKDPEVFLHLGEAHDKLYQPDKAIQVWQEALRLKPDWGLALSHLAETHWRRNETDLAAKQYRRLQEKDPKLARSLQEKIPDLARHVANLDRTVPPGGSQPPVTATPSDVAKEELDKGRKYFEAKDFPNARKALEQAVKLNSQEAEAHYLLGLTYTSLQKPQTEKAMDELGQAVSLKSETYSWKGIGEDLTSLKSHKLAAEAFKKVVDANPNDAQARYQLGEAYARANNIESAREVHKVLKEQDKELAEKLMASINAQRGRQGGGRSLASQIDAEARRIRIRRGEIPPAGATPRRTPTANRSPAPRSPSTPGAVFQRAGPTTTKQR